MRMIKCAIFILLPAVLWAGTTGKIAGRVIDQNSRAGLPGVNILLEGTTLGAATDINGDYAILNIPPGVYNVVAKMLGYQSLRQTGVKVTIDLTTPLNFQLSSTVLDINETVTVVAERPLVRKDVTSSHAVVATEDIKQLPVENFNQVLTLQAGVVQGSGGELHIRGGRSGEVRYMVDGISVTDPYSSGMALSVENEAIQEMEFVSGTFNAEYGQAMSGIVNIVTKEGGKKLTGEVVGYLGDYLSTDTDLYDHIDDVTPLSNKDVRANISGPVPFTRDKVSFFLSGRALDQEGFLYGQNRFTIADSNDFSQTAANWQESGDGSIVAMNPYRKFSGQWKFAYNVADNIKITLGGLADWSRSQSYSHKWKYTPSGRPTSWGSGFNNVFTLTHTLSPKTFYAFRYSNFYNYGQSYVFKDPLDSRYVSSDRLNASSGYRFYAGGVNLGHYKRYTLTHIAKFEIISQVSKIHQLKAGMEFEKDKLFGDSFTIQIDQSTDWKPKIPDIALTAHDRYVRRPRQLSGFLQDKIELRDMIVNVGLRFEYFDPNSQLPTDQADPSLWVPNRYRSVWAIQGQDTMLVKMPYRLDPNTGERTYIDPNTGKPMNGVIPEGHLATTIGGDRVRLKGPATIIDPDTGEPLQGSGNAAWFKKSSAKYQISPRVGIAFPITERGVIHFSYGHFLQIPAYSYLYSNPDFEVVSGLSTIMGNANLEPQRTVGYEIGLQQQLTEDLGLNVTGFYKDVRNLLGTQIIETYAAGDRYALYTNRDYGNIRGITLTLDKRYSGLLSAKLDYTYSVSEGNASDPEATFYDTSNDIEPEKQLVALDWDQRHTVNGSVNLGVPNNWNISFIAQLGSGLPYTPEYRGTRTAFENAGRKPYQLNIDMRAHKMFAISGMRFGVYLVVYNLFDRRNEDYVYSDTGRATYSLIPMYTPESIGPNTLSEYLRRPDYYSSPREIKLGLSVGF